MQVLVEKNTTKDVGMKSTENSLIYSISRVSSIHDNSPIYN